MRSYDPPMNRDEWPNLSSLADDRPRFPDGEPVSPLSPPPRPVARARLLLALGFIGAALLVRACEEVAVEPPAAAARR